MPELVNGKRKVWNPLARYYIEPAGEWIAEKLQHTNISPNMVTVTNLILGVLSCLLIYMNTPLSLIIFAIWVRVFHMIDIVDGHLARLTNKKSKFGALLDGVGDRIIVGLWSATIIITAYLKTPSVFLFLVAVAFFFGEYMFANFTTKADKLYGSDPSQKKEEAKSNPLAKIFLFFIDNDIQLHFLSLVALFYKPEIFIIFYAIYLNLLWISYLGFYSLLHIKKGV